MDKDLQAFLLYGFSNTFKKKECIKNLILQLLLSIPLVIVDRRSWISIIYFVAPFIYFIYVWKVRKIKIISGYKLFLHNGIMSSCMTAEFALIGIRILVYLVPNTKRALAVILVIICYVFLELIYIGIVRFLIIKEAYSKVGKTNLGLSVTFAGIMGICIARTFMQDMSNRQAFKIICILSFFLSGITLLGSLNIFKYNYCMKYKEDLKEITE